jgi:hypothetical protein
VLARVRSAAVLGIDAYLVVVEDVQQRLQDEFVDTTWPACPRHPNHPLNFVDGVWHCPQDGAEAPSLGELPPN